MNKHEELIERLRASYEIGIDPADAIDAAATALEAQAREIEGAAQAIRRTDPATGGGAGESRQDQRIPKQPQNHHRRPCAAGEAA